MSRLGQQWVTFIVFSTLQLSAKDSNAQEGGATIWKEAGS